MLLPMSAAVVVPCGLHSLIQSSCEPGLINIFSVCLNLLAVVFDDGKSFSACREVAQKVGMFRSAVELKLIQVE